MAQQEERHRNLPPSHRIEKSGADKGKQKTYREICSLSPGLYNDLVKNDFWISSEHCTNILNTAAQQNER